MKEENINRDFTKGFAYKAVISLQDDMVIEEKNGLVVSDFTQSISDGGTYEIPNMSLTFNNVNFEVSWRFNLESPLDRKVTVYMMSNNGEETQIFIGIVDSVTIKTNIVGLNLVT